MRTTYSYIVYDVLKELKKITANADITVFQVKYWAITLCDQIRAKRIGQKRTGAYLNIYSNVPIIKPTSSVNPNVVANRKYVELPAPVYDMLNDAGVAYVTWNQKSLTPTINQNSWTNTTPMEAFRLQYSPYEIPNKENPYWYRIENKIYFLGLEYQDIDFCEMGLYQTLQGRSNLVNLTDEIDLDAADIPVLRQQLLALGRFMQASPPSDRINDGDDGQAQVKEQKSQQQPTE